MRRSKSLSGIQYDVSRVRICILTRVYIFIHAPPMRRMKRNFSFKKTDEENAESRNEEDVTKRKFPQRGRKNREKSLDESEITNRKNKLCQKQPTQKYIRLSCSVDLYLVYAAARGYVTYMRIYLYIYICLCVYVCIIRRKIISAVENRAVIMRVGTGNDSPSVSFS